MPDLSRLPTDVIPPIIQGSWFELWHPLYRRPFPTLSELVARADADGAQVLRAAGRLAARRFERASAVERARKALFDDLHPDLSPPPAPKRQVEREDLLRALLACAPGPVRGIVEAGRGEGAIDEAWLAKLLETATAHLEDAPEKPVDALEADLARSWAMWLARCPDEVLDTRTLLASHGGWDLGRLSRAVVDPTRNPLEVEAAMFQGFDLGVHEGPIPAWIGPAGLFLRAEGLGPEAVLVGGAVAAELARALAERASLRGPVRAGPLVLRGSVRSHVRILRFAGDPARRLHRSLADPATFRDVDRRADERLLFVVDPARMAELHRLRPEVADWPHLLVPELPPNTGLLTTLCRLANLSETRRGEPVTAGRVLYAYAAAGDPDRVGAAVDIVLGWLGSPRRPLACVPDLLLGRMPASLGADEAAWITEHAGSIEDLAAVCWFVDRVRGTRPLHPAVEQALRRWAASRRR